MLKKASHGHLYPLGVVLALAVFFVVPCHLEAATLFSGTAKNQKQLDGARRISSELVRMNEAAKSVSALGISSVDDDTRKRFIQYVDDLPVVEIVLDSNAEEAVQAAVDALTDLGMTITHISDTYGMVCGAIAPDLLDELNDIPHLTLARPNYKPILSYGAVDSEGDAAMLADAVRDKYGVDGSGITVGVISNSFNSAGIDLSSHIEAGDLPGADNPNGYTTPVTVLEEYTEDGSDEGRAMVEIVHDTAPGATLMFHTAFLSKADFAESYDNIVENGADVIVDDVTYYSETWFQDGIVAQAAQSAVDQGILVFSAACNSADNALVDTYRDINPDETDGAGEMGKDLHDFGGGDPYARVTIPAGSYISAAMQWAEPFDGTLGPGAETDLDLYLYNLDTGKILAASMDSQGCSLEDGGGDPYEYLYYVNGGDEAVTVGFVVDRFCGSNDNLQFKILCARTYLNEYDAALFTAPTVIGHSAAEGVIAVGAVDAWDTDAYNDPPLETVPLEAFSSYGDGIALYFDENGHDLDDAPVLRSKPDLSAPDGVSTATAGFETFYGTSAAAPGAAALSALMLQYVKTDPLLVTDCMRAGAVDVGETGWDGFGGNGLVNGENAMALLDAGGTGVYAIDAGSSAHGDIYPAGRMIGYTPADGSEIPAQTHTFTFIPDDYYHVADVVVNDASQGALSGYSFSGVDDNQTLYVQFEADTFQITATAGDGGRIVPSGAVAMTHDDVRQFEIEADTGYTLADVLVDGESAGALAAVSFSEVTCDHSVTAVFTPDTYVVTPTATGHGAVQPSEPQQIAYGGNLTFTINADGGYHIEQILLDGTAVEIDDGITSYALYIARVTGNMDVSAVFAQDAATATSSPKRSGDGGGCFISGALNF